MRTRGQARMRIPGPEPDEDPGAEPTRTPGESRNLHLSGANSVRISLATGWASDYWSM
jgi:hypothetical protein